MQHIVMFSGGLGSFMAARRVIDRHGPGDVTLLFADTCMEDEDLYRFVADAVAHLGARLVTLRDGRTPWDVFRSSRYLGNTRVDPCSRVLKREPCQKWLKEHCDPRDTTVYLGIDWTESHRFDRVVARNDVWKHEAPLCEAPYLTKDQIFAHLKAAGIEPPRLYAAGFTHNNCGGFCCKAGQAHFANLLKTNRDRYLFHEAQEEDLRATLQKDVAILRDRTGGVTTPMPLKVFRERTEAGQGHDKFEWGGCGCFSGEETAEAGDK